MYSGNLMMLLAGAFIMLMMGSTVAADSLPAPIKRCRMEDEACLVKQAQIFIETFKHGLPERNIPPTKIIRLGTLRVSSGEPGSSMQFNLVMSNTTLHNFVDTMVFKTMKGFSKDLSKPMQITWTVSSTGVDVYANYDVNGKIFILPLESQGEVVVKLNQLQAKSRITAVPEKRKDGKTYLKISDYKTIAKTESGHINMTNLFNDNLELRESTLKVLNDEYDLIAKDVHPQIMKAVDRVFRSALQKFWDTIPYEEFFEN